MVIYEEEEFGEIEFHTRNSSGSSNILSFDKSSAEFLSACNTLDLDVGDATVEVKVYNTFERKEVKILYEWLGKLLLEKA
jgi:hypothetical protein